MWRQLELVAIVCTASTQKRSVNSNNESRVASLLGATNQLPSDVAVTVNVQLKEAQRHGTGSRDLLNTGRRYSTQSEACSN